MTDQPEPIRRWHKIVHARNFDALDSWLADDAVFVSPAVHTPQTGRTLVKKYLVAAAHVLMNESFHYVGEWFGERSAVLEFEATLDGLFINGVDIIHWDEHGRVLRFKVIVRPLKALQTVVPLMASRLAANSGTQP